VCWSTKAAIIISETRKDSERVTMDYRNGTIPDPLRPPLPQDLGFATPKTSIAIISGMGKYRLQIWLVHSQGPSEQKPFQNFGEKGAWAYAETAQFFSTPYYLRNEYSYTNFKFCTHIHGIDRNKSPLKISGKVVVVVLRDSRKFSEHHKIIYGRIARSSLR